MHIRRTSRRAMWLVAAVLGASLTTAAAPADPSSGKAADFFGPTRVHTFHLTITAADFRRMPPPNGRGGRGLMGGFRPDGDDSGFPKVPARLEFDGKDWGPVTVRYKGNSTYRSAPSDLKRSLKIDFDAIDRNGTFFGLTKLNLNNNAFDPSQMREAMAYDIFRHAGVAAPRTAFAKVYITVPGEHAEEYAGLFTAIEEIDQAFFKDRWGEKVGVLVKPEGIRGMPYLGADWTRYERPYGSKITAKPEDAARLMAFFKFVEQSSDDEFAQGIEAYLDVDAFLRFLAGEVVLVNTDSPLGMNHNYWITVHPGTHKVMWVPWDMNMAFGGFMTGDSNLSVRQPSSPGVFPLADRLLANRLFEARYERIVREMVTGNMTTTRIGAAMNSAADAIRAAVADDPTLALAGFERQIAEDPSKVLDGGTASLFARGRSGPPLRSFIDNRIFSVVGQLDGTVVGTPGRGGRGGFLPPPPPPSSPSARERPFAPQ